ncbi:translation elongation factor ef1b/ribosomal protein s6 [Lucifera butyrica]|uniref:Translation elongation factor ef1b/ribosomal protein s6 n=1 Tax=Lucifera butyrica TaxID=1351585 RepID=A0A498R6P1_9FIRM|nr:type 4a pilus biogenesis protein PilO [Lucifera butyrica]VBB06869.1 translation elongation factor ef1b/ribosomal protein s6 [Lucifera butyrica]
MKRWDALDIKYKLALAAAGLVLLAGLFIAGVVVPQERTIQRLKGQYQAERGRVEVVEAFAQAHPDPDRYLADVDKQIALTDNMLPDNVEVSGFMAQVEKSSRDSGSQLVEVKPGQAAAKSGYQEIPIEITVRGHYFAIMNFMVKLQDGPRFSIVKNIDMHVQSGKNASSSSPELEGNLAVTIYSYGNAKPKANAAPGPHSVGKLNKNQ